MATGGGEDVADVAEGEQQAEAVFLSYTFHMAAMRSENEDIKPLGDEIEDARQCDSNIDTLGKKLATIGDDIYKRYESTFDNFLKDLDPNLGNAYDMFKKIAARVDYTEAVMFLPPYLLLMTLSALDQLTFSRLELHA
ncbi:bcl-2 homologous antagonist/killer isoform X3 [Ranitomeya variabilis]|uniref:bcl-2 homologous antagonist/killer isoform X3 n=1 Tax=Ranitomeya variabilis TaxID=490064 RepID=UPI0040574B06